MPHYYSVLSLHSNRLVDQNVTPYKNRFDIDGPYINPSYEIALWGDNGVGECDGLAWVFDVLGVLCHPSHGTVGSVLNVSTGRKVLFKMLC